MHFSARDVECKGTAQFARIYEVKKIWTFEKSKSRKRSKKIEMGKCGETKKQIHKGKTWVKFESLLDWNANLGKVSVNEKFRKFEKKSRDQNLDRP